MRIAAVALLIFAAALPSYAQTVPLADGRTVWVRAVEASSARASAILLVGGRGRVSPRSKNFLVRVQPMLAEAGITSVLVDVPSDRGTLSTAFRATATHADDLARVAEWANAQYGFPVWVIGTSSGTISAVNLVARKGADIAGMVLSASVTEPRPRSELAKAGVDGVLGMLNDIPRIPVLVLHHRNDACPMTPAYGAKSIYKKLAQSPRRKLVLISGGEAGKGNPCKGKSYHGCDRHIEWHDLSREPGGPQGSGHCRNGAVRERNRAPATLGAGKGGRGWCVGDAERYTSHSGSGVASS